MSDSSITRRRRSSVGEGEATQNKKIEALRAKIVSYHNKKLAENKAKREAEKIRKEVLKEMDEQRVSLLQAEGKAGAKKVSLTAEIVTPDRVSVDIEKLRKAVDEETFLNIVSATQTSVINHAGKTTLNKVSTTKKGTRNVTVKSN